VHQPEFPEGSCVKDPTQPDSVHLQGEKNRENGTHIENNNYVIFQSFFTRSLRNIWQHQRCLYYAVFSIV